jgi:hypothetical protein
MVDERDSMGTVHSFAQANPEGGPVDLPALLRRVADTIESLGAVEVHDLVMHTELNDTPEWWPSLTVYYTRDDD